jgi:hypothetical protein
MTCTNPRDIAIARMAADKELGFVLFVVRDAKSRQKGNAGMSGGIRKK